MNSTAPLLQLAVATPQGLSGTLLRGKNDYLYTCTPTAPPEADVSLTMPNRPEQYVSRDLHPIFQMNLPEGYVLEQLRNRFAKAALLDPMLLLAMTGQGASIGRVSVSTPHVQRDDSGRGERLDAILAWDGAEDLFAELADRYLLRTGASGMQPKLLVPEDVGDRPALHNAAVVMPELIVKSAGEQFPGLAVNEFVCMSIAREAGLPVPDFHLSKNARIFVMRRFDRAEDGSALGFEDMAVLMGKGSADKYASSYEAVARAIELYCAPARQREGLAQLFDQVALSCILGNGDAHLKNFGVLYRHPGDEDVRLAPAYDIVNTTAYLRDDGLALLLGGSKTFFAARANLDAFAERCRVNDMRRRIEQLLDAAERVVHEQQAVLETEPHLEPAMRVNMERYARLFA